MDNPRRIILFGNTIFMAGVESSLRNTLGLDVTRVDDHAPDAAQTLRAHRADTIVFDSSAATPHCLMPLLEEFPNLVIIGIDPSKDRALVLSSQQPAVLNMRELAQVILQK